MPEASDSKWQLCSLICLNKGQEIYVPDLDVFCHTYIIPEEIEKQLYACKTYCECCKILKCYAFLFCKHYTGSASFILICPTCENYNGKECVILDEIVVAEAKNLINQDRYLLFYRPLKES